MASSELTCVIPVYRRASVLARAVQSVLAQEVPVEMVLVDDGSGDDSWTEMERLRAAHPERIQCLQLARNSGQSAARNAGAGLAATPSLAFLDSDDEWAPQFAAACLAILAKEPKLAAVRTGIEYVGLPEALRIAPGDVRYDAQIQSSSANLVVRHAAFWALGGYPRADAFRTRLGGEDTAFSRGLGGVFFTGMVPRPLYRYHWSAGNALDIFASRTRSSGQTVEFAHLEAQERDGSLDAAQAAHEQRVRARMGSLKAMLPA